MVWLMMIDLSAAFDVVDIGILLDKMKVYGFRESVIKWLHSYLHGRKQQVYVDGCLSEPLSIKFGVPQGSILGPLLYTIYTNDLPEVIHDHEQNNVINSPFNLPCGTCGGICCFADDSSFSLSSANPSELEILLSNRYSSISDYMLGNRLLLNSDKTHFMVIATQSQHRKNDNFGITLNTGMERINPSESECILGLNVQNDLTWNEHILLSEKSIVKNLSRKINGLGKICALADFKTRKMLANGFIYGNLVYMIQLYGQGSDYLMQILQVQQNRAARIVTRLGLRTHTSELLNQVGWLSVRQLFVFHSVMLVWKIKSTGQPLYLKQKFQQEFAYNTRQATRNNFSVISRPRSELSRQSFVHNSIFLWNSLPQELKQPTVLSVFKSGLKQWVRSNIPI